MRGPTHEGKVMATKTGVQLNEAHTSTDKFITEKYVLPILLDKKRRAAIIEEHKSNPVGTPGLAGNPGIGHSDDLQRVVDKFRRAPMAGKYVRVCMEPHKDYRIAIVSGVRGEPVKILPKPFPSEDACEHGVFLKRLKDMLAEYGEK